ncbi:S8 family serine peptidase [Streptomyces xiaopingdaonensis]|uniref:S8 family serine peptidase n=1 Tax=Streptomyces xiaopingdaonensis TaxID=1565415 RepID=UPI001ED90460|nr:S8 family serine peptidase [Streptomyces xiaopingdaonensis]
MTPRTRRRTRELRGTARRCVPALVAVVLLAPLAEGSGRDDGRGVDVSPREAARGADAALAGAGADRADVGHGGSSNAGQRPERGAGASARVHEGASLVSSGPDAAPSAARYARTQGRSIPAPTAPTRPSVHAPAHAASLHAASLPVPHAAPAYAGSVHASVKKPARVDTSCRQAPEKGGAKPPAAKGAGLVERLGLAQAWDLAQGEGVTVGVVDSGVDDRHPGLDGVVGTAAEVATVRTKEGFRIQQPRSPDLDCEGHGTAVAGLIAAQRTADSPLPGVAPGARVRSVRVADGVENASGEALAAAIDRAAAGDAKILNLSFALPVDRAPVRAAVRRAVQDDVLVVAAAGNEGSAEETAGSGSAPKTYPAAYKGVLAVGAVAADGQPMQESNSGDWVDLAAYGEEEAVLASGGRGFRSEKGTSFAAPQVAAAAALVRSRHPGLDAGEVADRLVASAAPVGGGRDPRTGAGVVDPFGALTQLAGGEDRSDAEERASDQAALPVQPVPEPRPVLEGGGRTAVVWSAVLLLAVVVSLLGAPAVRRAARRGWRAGPTAAGHDGQHRHAPREQPAAHALERLTGPPEPPPGSRSTSAAPLAQTVNRRNHRTS